MMSNTEQAQSIRRLSVDQGVFQLGQTIDGEAANDLFSTSMALSRDGTTLAVGAPSIGGNGHVRLFRFDLTQTLWIQLGSDIDGTSRFDDLGSAVSISADGNIVAAGAGGIDAGGS